MEGFLLIDKPSGMTSHDVVDVVRKVTGEQRVGHAGTLDPFATGLLIVGVGRAATKRLGELTNGTTKTYEAALRLGATSDSDDPDGTVTERENVQPVKKSDVVRVVHGFRGELSQIPPVLSALKIHGVPAYRRVRRGESIHLAARPVEIHDIHVRKYAWPDLTIEVTCGAGTYIRSLARDIGSQLGCGAYLTALRRTAIGQWNVRTASQIGELSPGTISDRLIPIHSEFLEN